MANSHTLGSLDPAIPGLQQITIHPDAPLKLRYRAMTHEGPPPLDVLQKFPAEWDAY
ncbi:MAG TPA: hypothetical protein VG273_26305 [Bryobacteraceae bacterium]|nr:hypothetical protein [Bryobacteraceae bacterium]